MDEATKAQKDYLLTEDQAARVLGVQPTTLSVWRSTKRYNLPYIKIGRNVRYRLSALHRFLDARTVG